MVDREHDGSGEVGDSLSDGATCGVCGPEAVAFSSRLGDTVTPHCVADSTVDASVSELNRWISQQDAAICVVCHSQGACPPELIVELVNALQQDPHADIALPVPDNSRLWAALPAETACRVWRPERDAPMAFRHSVWADQGPLTAVSHSLWEWLLRATSAGRQVVGRSSPLLDAHTSLPDLAPQPPDSNRDWLKRLLLSDSVASSGGASTASMAWQAGLLQIHDYLDESHQFSQSIEGRGRFHDGDYWHAIMHRREPDFSNSKYWFRRVGPHPVFDRLRPVAAELLAVAEPPQVGKWHSTLCGSSWDPLAFVDLCQHALSTQDQRLISVAQQIQYVEMELLLGHCWQALTA
ncbi:MAG: hypothetical protein ABGZ17_04070 [Planctomycetaceae bacterium]